jgi:hypothetical protein
MANGAMFATLVVMKYLEKVRKMERHFKGYSLQHIPRNDNNEAD